MVRQLIPAHVNNVDVERLYAEATREVPDARPWIVVGMIESADGAATADGRSGGLGGAADKRVFRALRAAADVILVAGGTVRAEGYGPVMLDAEARAARRERGQAELPRLAIVSASLRLGWEGPLFAESATKPVVITSEDADLAARATADRHADVIARGTGRADLGAALAELRSRGARVVLCEGGPSLNGAMLAADVVDEVALSLAPALVGGDDIRIFRGGAPSSPRQMRLAHVLEDGDYLFLRYVRRSA